MLQGVYDVLRVTVTISSLCARAHRRDPSPPLAPAVEGREGANFAWAATLNYDCAPVNDSCFSMPLRATGQLGGKNFSVTLPPYPGTLEVSLDVRTYGGYGATAQKLHAASVGSSACTCRGNRTITAYFMGTPSRTPSPSHGWRAAAAKKPAGGVNTKSPLFVGLLSAAATLVAIALVVVALYASGTGATLMARMGGSSGGGGSGGALTRPLRRPTTRSATDSADTAPSAEPRKLVVAAATGAADTSSASAAAATTAAPAAAATAAANAAAGTGMPATATSAVAARRAAANITPLDSPAGGSSAPAAAAAAPSRPSPAEKAQTTRTPSGARRV